MLSKNLDFYLSNINCSVFAYWDYRFAGETDNASGECRNFNRYYKACVRKNIYDIS